MPKCQIAEQRWQLLANCVFRGFLQTFVVLNRNRVIFRFNAVSIFCTLSPFSSLRRVAIKVLVNPYPPKCGWLCLQNTNKSGYSLSQQGFAFSTLISPVFCSSTSAEELFFPLVLYVIILNINFSGLVFKNTWKIELNKIVIIVNKC